MCGVCDSYEVNRFFYLFPLTCSLLPAPCSLKPRTLYLTQIRIAIKQLGIS
ncbi:MAG: hypothetical protein F6J98_46830, partial [Moorea sp. SIO4G2]|nr:hypothetical protein [Moorena sp. SIO4G2]